MFNKGLIIVNAYCVYASVEHQAKRLAIEFKNLGIDIDIKENNFLASVKYVSSSNVDKLPCGVSAKRFLYCKTNRKGRNTCF